jgi:hypothetical protein
MPAFAGMTGSREAAGNVPGVIQDVGEMNIKGNKNETFIYTEMI